MNAQGKLLISGAAALTVLLLSGCDAMYVGTGYTSAYIGGYGPYYSGYGPYYGSDFVIGGTRFRNYAGGHHFYGQSFGSRHFSQGGGRPQIRSSGGGRYQSGRRGGGHH